MAPTDSVNVTRTKEEKGYYRVVHAPTVMVRAEPATSGRALSCKECGDVVRTDMRTVGGESGGAAG